MEKGSAFIPLLENRLARASHFPGGLQAPSPEEYQLRTTELEGSHIT